MLPSDLELVCHPVIMRHRRGTDEAPATSDTAVDALVGYQRPRRLQRRIELSVDGQGGFQPVRLHQLRKTFLQCPSQVSRIAPRCAEAGVLAVEDDNLAPCPEQRQ